MHPLFNFYGYALNATTFECDPPPGPLLRCITAVGVAAGAKDARGFGLLLAFIGRKLYLGDSCGRL